MASDASSSWPECPDCGEPAAFIISHVVNLPDGSRATAQFTCCDRQVRLEKHPFVK